MSRTSPVCTEELARHYYPLVIKIAAQMARRIPPQVSFDDLLGAGLLGLAAALNRFDLGRVETFKSYAEHRIRGEILDELRRRDLLSRDARTEVKKIALATHELNNVLGREAQPEEVALQLGISVDHLRQAQQRALHVNTVSTEDIDYELAQNTNDPFKEAFLSEARARLAEQIKMLPGQQSLVLWLYYYEELPLREIAEILEVTPSRICQIRSAAISRLRFMLQDEACVAA